MQTYFFPSQITNQTDQSRQLGAKLTEMLAGQPLSSFTEDKERLYEVILEMLHNFPCLTDEVVILTIPIYEAFWNETISVRAAGLDHVLIDGWTVYFENLYDLGLLWRLAYIPRETCLEAINRVDMAEEGWLQIRAFVRHLVDVFDLNLAEPVIRRLSETFS